MVVIMGWIMVGFVVGVFVKLLMFGCDFGGLVVIVLFGVVGVLFVGYLG